MTYGIAIAARRLMFFVQPRSIFFISCHSASFSLRSFSRVFSLHSSSGVRGVTSCRSARRGISTRGGIPKQAIQAAEQVEERISCKNVVVERPLTYHQQAVESPWPSEIGIPYQKLRLVLQFRSTLSWDRLCRYLHWGGMVSPNRLNMLPCVWYTPWV